MNKIKKIGIFAVLLATVIATFGITFPASAAVGNEEIIKHAMVAGLQYCYGRDFLNPRINIDNFAYGDPNVGTTIFNDSEITVHLPNGTVNGDHDMNSGDSDSISCSDLFLGKGLYSGIGLPITMTNTDPAQKAEVLTKLGYTPVGPDIQHCFKISYYDRLDDGKPEDEKYKVETQSICFDADANGKIKSTNYTINGDSHSAPIMLIEMQPASSNQGRVKVQYLGEPWYGQEDEVSFTVGEDYTNFKNALDSTIRNRGDLYDDHEDITWRFAELRDTTTESGSYTNWELTEVKKNTAWRFILNTQQTTFRAEEKLLLYEYYIAQYGDFKCSRTSGYTEAKFEINGKEAKMWIKRNTSFIPNTLYTPNVNLQWNEAVHHTFEEVLDAVKDATLSGTYINSCEDTDNNPTGPIKSGGSGGTMDLKECFNGADALGWILCPVIKFLHATVQNIYDSIIEPFLQVNVSAFDTSSGTFQGWQVFQGIANVLFVILFLFVIFSQVTGIGIDNYGIKRILPKLIVTAILINISYFICQLLVDASNILGAGLEGIFSNVQINGSAVSTGQSALTTAITGLVGAAGIGGAIATAEMWVPALIVPLLLGLITILISVAFMFVLLGVRQAGVIILVVVAPVAFVCYMLPNTKPIFDKWKKMLEGLLMLYPICGALIGGSALASKILTSSSNNFFMHLLAALLTVVPFFFVPKLLQGAFSAMGNIGGKISAMGSNLSRRAGGAVANSQAVKDAQLRAAAGVNSRGEATAMGKRMDKIARGKSIFSRVPGMQRAASRSMARGRAAYLKDRSDQLREDRLNTEGYMESAIAEQDAQLDTEQVATEQAKIEGSAAFTTGNYAAVANDMVDLMRTDKDGNNSAKIRAIQNALNKIGDDGRSAMGTAMEGLNFADISNEARQAWASNLLGAHAADFKNNARSQYEAAKANTGAASGNFNDFVAGGTRAPKVDSYRPEQFANMDDGEFNSIMNAVNNMKKLQSNSSEWGKLSSEEQERINNYVSGIQKVANSAVSDPRLRSSLKGSRAEGLAKLSEGYIDVPRNNASGSSSSGGSTTETLDEIMQEAGYQENYQNQNTARQKEQQRADNMDAADRVGDNYEEIFDNQRDNS